MIRRSNTKVTGPFAIRIFSRNVHRRYVHPCVFLPVTVELSLVSEDHRVSFPNTLPVRHLFQTQQHTKEQGLIQLTEVICHIGDHNINSGHFFPMLRTKSPGAQSDRWMKLDDLKPRSMECVVDNGWMTHESIQSGTYMWIYERIRDSTDCTNHHLFLLCLGYLCTVQQSLNHLIDL